MQSKKLGKGGRFESFVNKLKKMGYDEESANAIAAKAGIKKYGKKKMQKWAMAERKKMGGKK